MKTESLELYQLIDIKYFEASSDIDFEKCRKSIIWKNVFLCGYGEGLRAIKEELFKRLKISEEEDNENICN